MGLALSCPEGEGEALNNSFEALLHERSDLRSLCSNGCDLEPSLMKDFGSGKFIIEGSVSVERRETEPTLQMESKISIKSPLDEDSTERSLKPSRFGPEALVMSRLKLGVLKHEAALKLQKVYRSFRTRRQLADCAVLVEQSWWKLLDFALLKRSSVSFFDITRPESIVSKWSRARTRAAKVGKGLSKNGRARKLVLQHWLEAIDPRHRYGHNLQFYYECWLRCESNQPFFYWLDVGEGKEINLNECLRTKLQQQCIRYLGPKEREAYEVIVEDGKLIYKKSRECLDTTGGPIDSKWIFVLGTLKNLYVGQKKKGMFQHSSFLAGAATSAAGSLDVENGVLKAVWPHSGHYRPTQENFEEFMSFLDENNVDLSDVKKAPAEDDNDWGSRLQSPPSEPDLINRNIYSESQLEQAHKSDCEPKQEKLCSFNDRTIAKAENSCKASNHSTAGSSLCKRRFGFHKPDLFIQQDDVVKEPIQREEILLRFYSMEGMKSYQLGEQITFRWTTGAGPGIGCVRGYPYELQFRALEQVSLSSQGYIKPKINDAGIICTAKEFITKSISNG